MDNITAALARVHVDDLDAALGLYRDLAGGAEPRRFSFGDVELAWIGPFLLMSGDTAGVRDRVATLVVRDLESVVADLERAGGELVDGPAAGPNGRRLIARHPDGAVFEYIEDITPE